MVYSVAFDVAMHFIMADMAAHFAISGVGVLGVLIHV